MADDVTVDLAHPIVVTYSSSSGDREEKIEKLQLRRPKLKDLRGINLSDLEQMKGDAMETLIQRLSGLEKDQVGEIDLGDMANLGDVIAGFFPKPAGGKKPPAAPGD